jgi:D-serine deaminase-like pyridoxal phosphate-dependent protein
MKSNPGWFHIDHIEEIDSPALVVFPDQVKKNIQTAIQMVGNVDRLRPHIKTHKSPDVVQLMLDAGITRFKCATIAEAEMLGMKGAPDVLLAYQPAGPKLKRFAELIKKYPATNYSCLTDTIAIAAEQSAIFVSNGWKVPVYIDLNVGMNRTGIAPGPSAIELYEYCASLKGIIPVGLHAYDGHIHDVDFIKRTADCDAAFAPVTEMKETLIKKGLPAPVIIAGGSHSFPIHCKRTGIECSPGTFIYWDKGNSDFCPEQNFLPAALLVTRIVSLPNENLICTDLGHKSVAAEKELTRRVYFLNAPELEAVSQSEEHLVLKANKNHSYKTGDILYGLPVHICPTVALYENVITVENGRVTGEWPTIARNRKILV